MKHRGIINPYQDCAINTIEKKKALASKFTDIVNSLLLHENASMCTSNYDNLDEPHKSLFFE